MKSRMKIVCPRAVYAIVLSAMAVSADANTAPSPDHPEWAAALAADGAPITVHRAKKIDTMVPGRPEASAIAVLDGRVLSTGTMSSMQPWLSRGAGIRHQNGGAAPC